MYETPWMILDALQAGALLSLAVSFGADGLTRRDRMVSLVALTCLLMCLRHAFIALEAAGLLGPLLVDRLQSGLASLSFITMIEAMRVVFSEYFPLRTTPWLALLMLPNFVRVLVIPSDHVLYGMIRGWVMMVYVVGCALGLASVIRARLAGNPMGIRLMGGILMTSVPILVEVLLLAFLDIKLRISGLSIVLLAISIGTSWQWLIAHGLQERIDRSEAEALAWRKLVPGPTWRTQEITPFMDLLFGAGWERRLQDRMVGLDGLPYELHRVPIQGGGEVGWIESRAETLPGTEEFLQGWTIALGMDDGQELDATRKWLSSWGASVQVWSTVPPREGPYPSIILWGREPSILQVWREDDLTRRKPRWIQIGGALVEGPHERLERPVEPGLLRQALQRLLSFGAL